MDDLDEIRARKKKELLERAQEIEGSKGYLDHPITVTDGSFHEIVRNNRLIVVDAWAPWCAPCRRVAPVIDALAKDYAGRVVFGKLNTDENRATSIHHQIMSIPTLLVFKDGREVDRIVGAVPKRVIEDRLNGILASDS